MDACKAVVTGPQFMGDSDWDDSIVVFHMQRSPEEDD